MNWKDASKEKPAQGIDVLMWLEDGSIHEGRFLKNANKYHMAVNKWKIYKLNRYIDEHEVIAWCEITKG